MENRVNYALVGIFVIGLLCLLVFIGTWLLGAWNGKTFVTYSIYTTGSVSGLSPSSKVKYNGVNVGYVSSITIDPTDPQMIRLLLKIENTIPITEATVASLVEQGITGVSFIDLSTEQPNARRVTTRPGDLYPVIKIKPSAFRHLSQSINDLVLRLTKTVDRFDKVFDEKARNSMHRTMINLDNITTAFAKNTKTLDRTIQHADAFFTEGSAAFKQGSLAASELKIGLKAFSGQTLPQVNQLLSSLNMVASDLNEVSSELVQNPSILIRGKAPPPKGPGE
jgi:phospholipid/cholesterol/gamma-HCH transport system substrate-binding protein